MEGLDVCLAEPEEELFGLWLQVRTCKQTSRTVQVCGW